MLSCECSLFFLMSLVQVVAYSSRWPNQAGQWWGGGMRNGQE